MSDDGPDDAKSAGEEPIESGGSEDGEEFAGVGGGGEQWERTAAVDGLPSEETLRVRALLDRFFVVVVVAIAIAVLVGGGLTYTVYADSGGDVSQQDGPNWHENGEFTQGATVVNESQVFDTGETLEDRTTYYSRISPTLGGSYQYAYGADSGDVETTIQLQLVVRSVDGDGDVLWEQVDELDRRTVDGLEPGEPATATFRIDVPAVEERIERIEAELGDSSGDTEVLVRASVASVGSVDGSPIETGHTRELSISPDGSTYGVETPEPYAHTHGQVDEQPAEQSPGPLFGAAGPLLLAGGLLAAVTVGWFRTRGSLPLSPAERRAVQRRRERAEFDDWITTGTVPPDIGDRPRIETDSLAGLVDVAIDCDRRVIEETAEGVYYVVDGTLVYVYDPQSDDSDGVGAYSAG